MTDPSPPSGHHPHVVVHPLQPDAKTGPYRRVSILGEYVGRAFALADVADFCRRAGLDELDLESETMVEWLGGGPEVWQ